MNSKLLKIGELAKNLQISTDTLRFYEQLGLIAPAARTSGGYRLYSALEKQKMQFILRAKNIGFSLEEIKKLLDFEVQKDKISCQLVKSKVDDKIVAIDKRIRHLKQIQHSLKQLSTACCGGDESAINCTILNFLNREDA